MVPLRLQLKNFLSYGAHIQTIDFSHFPLICLSGKNGHGKSALLDAITWALWGQARKISNTSKADQGLVRLGQTQMMVILDFECEANTYRVKREYMITYGKPVASLEFGIYQGNSLLPLTDKTIKATQHKIIQTLHLDYASFTNSAFLRQGHSNEFSKKSPKDRKQILATILGINDYDILRKAAYDKVRHITTQQQVHKALQANYAIELKTKSDLTEHIEKVHTELTFLEQKEQEVEKEQAQHRQKYQELIHHEQDFINISKEYDACIEHERTTQQTLNKTQAQLVEVRKKLLHMHDLPSLIKEKELLLEQEAALQKQFQIYASLKQASLDQEQVLNTLQINIERTHSQQVHAYELEHTKKKAELERLCTEKQVTLASYHKTKHNIDTLATLLKDFGNEGTVASQLNVLQEKHLEKTKTYQHTKAQYEATKKELKIIAQKEHTITGNSPHCPLCEQSLSVEQKDLIYNNLQTQQHTLLAHLAQLERDYKRSAQDIVQTEEQLNQLHTQAEAIKQNQQKKAELRANKNRLQEVLTEYKQKLVYLEQEINTVSKQFTQLSNNQPPPSTTLLQQNAEYMTAVTQLKELQHTLTHTSYQLSEHEKIRTRLTELDNTIKDTQARHDYVAQEEKYQGHIHELKEAIKQCTVKTKSLAQQRATYAGLAHSKQELINTQAALEQKKSMLHTQRSNCLETKGRLAHKRDALAQVEANYNRLQKELVSLQREKHDYQLIANATGKDGIQALIIEQALPEIEHEANAILSRLTDNQTTIMFESLRDLKKGGSRETLDIKISDASGIRPYELFSGGEAFRIDFAVRIAISKLLARRAGSSLQTLIIDEGFGSQDEQGLNNIMEALYAIQQDFNKIIIVSHLTSMKNQFPVHFVITKHASGSEVHITQHG